MKWLLTEIDNELNDLETGDPLLPPDTDTTGTLEVVPVHDDVHQKVDVNDNPLNRSQTNKLGIAEKRRSAVVVGMKEGKRLLLEEQEDSVDEFEVLGQVVELFGNIISILDRSEQYLSSAVSTYVVQNNKRPRPSTVVITDSIEDTMSPDSREKLLNEESQESAADQGEVKIVDHEESVELEGRSVLHELTATKDDDIVGNERHGGFLESRHGRHAFFEAKFAGGIAHHHLEGLVEDRP